MAARYVTATGREQRISASQLSWPHLQRGAINLKNAGDRPLTPVSHFFLQGTKVRNSYRLAALVLTSSLAACAETGAALQSLNSGLSQVNQALAPSPNGVPTMFAPSLSADQRAQLSNALAASVASRDAGMRNMVASAQPVGVAVMSKAACYQHWNNAPVLRMYSSANLGNGTIYGPWGVGSMQYAPKNRCLSVLRTDSWKQKSLNAFQFRAVYYSPESGESQGVYYEFINQDGSWLLNRTDL
ncbi:hypothetical protein [Burkholderia sp. 8Y]|uniref:hypothetical protein n=1 Tax=Burkholderia sp. 8Y TaxID=2653133 RepID=UPI00135B1DD6|nr:hypothetical protein [Burkholderia sp. 8Y]